MSEQFAPAVALLADNILHPDITPEGFSRAQRLVGQLVDARGNNPAVLARRAFLGSVLPPGDPALRHATSESVKALTEADVKAYYRIVFRPDMTTIVVVGNIGANSAESVLSRYFGGWRDQGKKPNIMLPAGVPNRRVVVHIKDPASQIDQVRLAELIPMVRSNPTYYALKLGNTLLSGGPYPGLFQSNPGLNRLPFLAATYISGRSRTFYLIDFAGDPGGVGHVVAAIRRDISQIEQAPPGKAEFDRTRAELLRSLILSRTSYSAIARGLLSLVTLSLPLDEPSLAAHAYLHLTPADVSAAMAKWVRPSSFSEVIQGPAP